jgi:hypothetical protein
MAVGRSDSGVYPAAPGARRDRAQSSIGNGDLVVTKRD